MKFPKISFLVLALCATVGHAQVILTVDDNVKVTAINGEAIAHGLFAPVKRNFELTEGQHVITARYERLFELHGDNHDILRSNEITVTASLADNQTYRLTMPNQPKRYKDAKEYIKAPSLTIVQGNKVVSEQVASSTQSGGVFGGLGALFGRGDGVASNQKAVQALQTPTKATTTNTTLDKFMELWLSADESEREKIRQWVQK